MKKNLYFGVCLVGFVASVLIISKEQISFAQAAWFFWSANFLFLPVFGFLSLVEYFVNYWPVVKERSEVLQSSKSFIGSPMKFIFVSLVTIFFAAIFHVVVGLFLSIALPVEPFQFFSIDGYNNNFNKDLILYHVVHFSELVPVFLLLKTSLLFLEQGIRLRGPGAIRDGIFPLVAGFTASLILQKGSPFIATVFFSAVLFFPWSALFGKDRFDKIATSEPEFEVPIELPVEYVYKPNVSAFWGFVLLSFGLLVLGLALSSTYKIAQAGQFAFIGAAIVAAIGVIVSTGFFFVAVNILFAYRKVILNRSEVEVIEKAFLVFIPRIRTLKSFITDYSRIQGAKKIFSTNTDTNAYYFVVEMIHSTDPKKNVELYRAYHSDQYLQIAEQWSKLLNVESVGTHRN